jgi:hypothetical protein
VRDKDKTWRKRELKAKDLFLVGCLLLIDKARVKDKTYV